MAQWRVGADALASEIGRVPGIGKVYVGGEDVKTLTDIADVAESPVGDDELLEGQARINVWQLTRTAISIEAAGLPQQQSFRIHRLVIRGYLGEGEGTFDTWQDLLDDVLDQLDRLTSVPVTDPDKDLFEISNLQVIRIGHTMFGPYACHSVEMQIDLREWKRAALRQAV